MLTPRPRTFHPKKPPLLADGLPAPACCWRLARWWCWAQPPLSARSAIWDVAPAPIVVTNTSGAASFNFRVMGIPVPGKIEGVKPSLSFSPDNLGATKGVVTLNLAGLNTGIALRDEHAREFLGVATHPTATFTLSKLNTAARILPGQTLNGSADGTLNLNGVSVPLKSPVTLKEAADGSVIEVRTAFDVTFAKHHISIPGADPKTDIRIIFRLPLR